MGEYTNNAHQPTRVMTFADLSISSITISQTTANGAWGGTQGNDTAVTVLIRYSSSRPSDTFQAAINWVKNAGGGGFDWVGLGTLGPVADNYPLTPGSRQSYALQYASSAVTITTGANINGSANTGGALNSLNTTFPLVNPPTFTNTNSTSGGNPSYAFSYDENRPPGTALGTVSATGGNGGALSFSITGGNANGWFAINSTTGAITITAAGAASLANDFETAPNAHTLTVQVTDGHSPVSTQAVLTELDLPDVPTAPLTVTKVSAVFDGMFAVPGRQIVYTIHVSNPSISLDPNSILIIDNLPAELEFYNGDFDPAMPGSGPIKFTDGSTSSGLSCCTSLNLSYSDSPAGTANPSFNYTPQAGFDPNVRFIRIIPTGTMAAQSGPATPSFTLTFRTRIK